MSFVSMVVYTFHCFFHQHLAHIYQNSKEVDFSLNHSKAQGLCRHSIDYLPQEILATSCSPLSFWSVIVCIFFPGLPKLYFFGSVLGKFWSLPQAGWTLQDLPTTKNTDGSFGIAPKNLKLKRLQQIPNFFFGALRSFFDKTSN